MRESWICTIEDAHGEWEGIAATSDASVQEGFRRMVPSAKAREALTSAWARECSEIDAGPAVSPAPEPAEVVEEASPAPDEPSAPVPVPPAHPRAPLPSTQGEGRTAEPTASPAPEPSPEADESTTAFAAPTAPAPAPAPAPDPESAPEPPPTLPEEEALTRLEAQHTEIRTAIPDLDGLAPAAIQRVLLHWVARMRYVEEQCPGVVSVERAGHAIARTVQDLAFLHWPGNIPALVLDALPSDCRQTLSVLPSDEPLDCWQKVARIAERELAQLETEEDLDSAGWADAAALTPAPNAPDALLEQLARRFDKLSADWTDKYRLPPASDLREPGVRGALLEIAEQLRWLRGEVEDTATWARILGSLRRIADKRRRELPDLGAILDPSHVPETGSWARLLGQDPEKKRKQREVRALYANRPAPDAPTETVRDWFREAAQLEIDPTRIRQQLRPHLETLGALGPEDFPGSENRKVRRVLGRIQQVLAAGPTDVTTQRDTSSPIHPRSGSCLPEREVSHAPIAHRSHP